MTLIQSVVSKTEAAQVGGEDVGEINSAGDRWGCGDAVEGSQICPHN